MKYLFVMVMLVFAAGGTMGENEERHTSGLLDEFIIMAYSGPPPEETTLERYREIAEAGIDYLVPGNGIFDRESNLKVMELAQQVGIKIIPVDMRMMPFALKPDVEVDEEVIRQVARDYKDHPVMAGYVVKDEPDANTFPALKTISDILRDEDPAHEPLVNLFPNYATIHQLGVDNYPAYMRKYIETVEPGLLSYDSYPLRLDGETIYDDWYGNLEIARKEALEAGIPFLVFMQSEGIKEEGLRVPNRSEILWQASTALAYGAQGVGWFCYWTPQPDQGFERVDGAKPPMVEAHHNAMIDIDGKRTKIHGYVRKANAYLKKAGNGLIGWGNIGVARFKAGRMYKGGSVPVAAPEGERANVVVGTFEKDGVSRLVVSNASCEEKAVFVLNILAEKEQVEVFASISAAPVGGKDSMLEWHLAPGGSVVLDLK